MKLYLLALLALTGCASLSAASQNYTVKSDCGGKSNCFATIQAAVDAAGKDTSGGWRTVDVAAGDYYEKVTISHAKLRLRGQGAGKTRLHFDAVAQTAGKYHRNNWGTPGSATLTIDAEDVTVEGLT